MQLTVYALAAEVSGEVDGEPSSGDRGLDRVHVDVVKHRDVEGRYTEAHEGKLDDGVRRRVEAPLQVVEEHRHLGSRGDAVLRRRAHRQDRVGGRAPRLEPRVALVEHLEPAPISPHAVDDDAREDLAEHLDQR